MSGSSKGLLVIWTGLILSLSMVSGCGWMPASAPREEAASPVTEDYDAVEYEMAPPDAARMAQAGGEVSPTASVLPAAEASDARKVIRTAELDLTVDSFSEVQDNVLALVDERGGFIASLTVNDHVTSRQAKIIVRVPSEHFHGVYQAIKALGHVERDHVGGQDVTEEYVDLERRIANLEAQETRVRAMFEEAESVEDLLKIEQRLTEVRGQIEGHQGRLRYLRDQVSFSTLTVSLHEYGEAPLQQTTDWRIAYHLRGAWRALGSAVQALITALIYLVIAGSIVWVPLAIVILLIRRWASRRRDDRARGESSDPAARTPEA